jgi:hypothetical protein
MVTKIYAKNILQGILFDANKMLSNDVTPKQIHAFIQRKINLSFVDNGYQRIIWK